MKGGVRVSRNLLGIILILLVLLGSTGAFAYWDSVQAYQQETVTLGEGLSLNIDAEVRPPDNSVLVPFGAVMKPGDVNKMTLEYLVALDQVPGEEVYLELLASNVRINGSTDYAHLVNFEYTTSAPTLSTGFLRAIVTITIDEPTSREMYEAVAKSDITFTINFHATSTIYSVDLDFTSMSMEDILAIGHTYDPNSWSSEENEALIGASRESRILFPITNDDEYTLTVIAQLDEGTVGGYGILFDTIVEEDDYYKDTGFAFQFDRGYTSYGGMILRPRITGREQNPIWTQLPYYFDLFPDKADHPDWWTDVHEIKIHVESINTDTRQATFYIDNIELASVQYNDVRDGTQVYVGFRGWSSSTSYYSLTVQ
jgi:hypothetical protein